MSTALYDKVSDKAASHIDELRRKHRRNNTLDEYYESVNRNIDLGAYTPPRFRGLSQGLGWCQVAIDSVAERISLVSVEVVPRTDDTDGTVQALSTYVKNVMADNEFAGNLDKAVRDFLLLGVTYVKVSRGDTEVGLPEILVSIEDPNRIYGDIDPETGLLHNALRVVSDERAEFYTRSHVYELSISAVHDNCTVTGSYEHGLGQVPIIPIVNRPKSTGWGSSDLTKPARLIFERAQRNHTRLEITAERYSVPQRVVLGAADGALDEEEDSVVSGVGGMSGGTARLLLDDRAIIINDKIPDPNGGPSSNDRASVSTLPASNPDNFIKALNNDRAEFAITCAIPDTYMGIEKSNPSSADAIRMAESRLVKKAESRIARLRSGVNRVISLIAKHYTGEVTGTWMAQAVFAKAHTPTQAATADAVIKLVGAGILSPTMNVTLRELGLSESDIRSIQNHRAEEEARSFAASVQALGGIRVEDRLPDGTPVGDDLDLPDTQDE